MRQDSLNADIANKLNMTLYKRVRGAETEEFFLRQTVSLSLQIGEIMMAEMVGARDNYRAIWE